MTRPRLRTAIGPQGGVRALKDGSVSLDGYELEIADEPVIIRAFRKMVRALEFDVCEMATTTYLCARRHGKPFTALPLFVSRGLHHGKIRHNVNAGIRHPKDLEGRRVGVNRGYTVTTGVWARGILQDEYGVDLSRVTWLRSDEEHVAEVVLPPNVATVEPGRSLVEMIISGELDAVVGLDVDHPDVVPLIPDADGVALTAVRERGFYPVNHLLVVRDDVLAANPGLATALFEAFTAAKDRYVAGLRAAGDESIYARVLAVTGADPLPYGVEPNRAMIDLLVSHAVDQALLDEAVPAEDLFVPETRKLVG